VESFFHSRDNSDKVLSASKDKSLIATIMIDPNSASARHWRSLRGKPVTKHGQASWVNGPNDWLAARSEAAHPKQSSKQYLNINILLTF
jgi:hypothetical protein